MSEQTESYIILKPISERFNRIANEITDDEIKNLIKSEMREQLGKIDFSSTISGIIEDYIDEHTEDIVRLYKDDLRDKFRHDR